MEQGIVYRKTEGLFDYVGWPTMIRAKNGNIYIACSGHRLGHICPFGKILLFDDTSPQWQNACYVLHRKGTPKFRETNC